MSHDQPRVLPHDLHAEMSMLGSMMLDARAVEVGRNALVPVSFYTLPHQDIFKAITTLAESGRPVDLVLLRDELRRLDKLEKVGGVAYLQELLDAPTSSANAEYYAQVVRRQQQLRNIESLRQDLSIGPGTDPDAILSELEAFVRSARDGVEPELPPTSEAFAAATTQLEERSSGQTNFICTGLQGLDRILHGLRPGMLSFVGGRPGDGKTSVALWIIAQACIRDRHPTLFHSLEMPAYQIAINLIRILTAIDYSEIARGRFSASTYQAWDEARSTVEAAPLLLDDKTRSIQHIRSRATWAVQKHSVELFIVDFIQMVRPERSGERHLEVASITDQLKAIAKDLGVHVLALSQLRRPSKDQPGYWLKESGAQEELADVVVLLGREEKYAEGKDPEPVICQRKFKVTKNRHGRTGIVYVTWDKRRLQFGGRELEHNGDGVAGGDGVEGPPGDGKGPPPDSAATRQGAGRGAARDSAADREPVPLD